MAGIGGITKETLRPGMTITAIGAPARMETTRLSQALAYSKGAINHLKSYHVLQVGSIKLENGTAYRFGMGPNF